MGTSLDRPITTMGEIAHYWHSLPDALLMMTITLFVACLDGET